MVYGFFFIFISFSITRIGLINIDLERILRLDIDHTNRKQTKEACILVAVYVLTIWTYRKQGKIPVTQDLNNEWKQTSVKHLCRR